MRTKRHEDNSPWKVSSPPQALDRMLDSLQQGTGFLVAKVDSCLAEVEDLLSYTNDILCTGAHVNCLYCVLFFIVLCLTFLV